MVLNIGELANHLWFFSGRFVCFSRCFHWFMKGVYNGSDVPVDCCNLKRTNFFMQCILELFYKLGSLDIKIPEEIKKWFNARGSFSNPVGFPYIKISRFFIEKFRMKIQSCSLRKFHFNWEYKPVPMIRAIHTPCE